MTIDNKELPKKARIDIEKKGVPYAVATIVMNTEASIRDNIIICNDREPQIKGIDYIVKRGNGTIYIDTKFRIKKYDFQTVTEVGGLDYLIFETRKANGMIGWGIDQRLWTDYIIDICNNTCYYVIKAKELKQYLADKYQLYPLAFNNKDGSQSIMVSTKELFDNNLIQTWGRFDDIKELGEYYSNGYDLDYNEYINRYIN